MHAGRQGAREAHSRPELDIGHFGVKELFGEAPLWMGSDAEKGGGIVAGHHGGALKGVLKDEILFPSQKSGRFQKPESESGRG
jgi:hypothetical protein